MIPETVSGSPRSSRKLSAVVVARKSRVSTPSSVCVRGVHARVADLGVDGVLDGLAERQVEVGAVRVGGSLAGLGGLLGARVRLRLVVVGGAAGEGQGRDEGEGRDRTGPAHSWPRSSGRASFRPWWISAFTVPSGAPTSRAISS